LSQTLNKNEIPWTYIPTTPVLDDFLYQVNYSYVLNRNKEGSVNPDFPANPDDLLKRPGWKETTHPEAGKKGHRTFENEETGEQIRHDEGKPGQAGHKGYDHYHHLKPNGKGGYDYVDGNGKIVPERSDESHIYPPSKTWQQP
jgi:hypothetical protein